MKGLSTNKMRVLGLLSENLKNPQPQVVNTERIAADLQMNLGEARQLLLHMDELGIIKIDMDGHYSLITQAGLSMISTARPTA